MEALRRKKRGLSQARGGRNGGGRRSEEEWPQTRCDEEGKLTGVDEDSKGSCRAERVAKKREEAWRVGDGILEKPTEYLGGKVWTLANKGL